MVCVFEWREASVLSPDECAFNVRVSHNVQAMLSRRKLLFKEAACTLIDLPAEILSIIMRVLFSTWTYATTVKRVSRQLEVEASQVQRDLEKESIAWWTGAGPLLSPGRPPEAAELKEQMKHLTWPTSSFARLGADMNDVRGILGKSWLSNFNIMLVLHATHQEAMLDAFYETNPDFSISLPVPDMIVLDPALSSVLYMTGDPTMLVREKRTKWAQPGVIHALCTARVLLQPLNIGNWHWVTLRAVPSKNMCELFLWMGTDSERDQALQLARHLMAYLAAIGAVRGEITYRVRVSALWKQEDSTSCGLFTLVSLISLLEGRRLHIEMAKPTLWRNYFVHQILSRHLA